MEIEEQGPSRKRESSSTHQSPSAANSGEEANMDWKSTNMEIQESSSTHQSTRRTSISEANMEEDTALQKFKIIYDRLEDPALLRCFLYCALFFRKSYGDLPYYSIERRELIPYLADVGVVEEGIHTTRRQALHKARSMLDDLHSLGLLTIASRSLVQLGSLVQMDTAFWTMALQILEHNQHPAMIKNGFSLKHLPDDGTWTEDLVTVGLAHNEIHNIPCNFSPRCSKLSMLLLSDNFHLRCIGDSFFDGMPGLQLLDLSNTSIESLPTSVCRLVNLTTLLLSMCRRLKTIPSVGKLGALKKLDLHTSTVEQVPEDIESLSNLTYLDLYDTEVAEFKSGTLPKLLALQFLRLPLQYPVNRGEFAFLCRLETLVCGFSHVFELNRYLSLLKWYPEPRAPLVLEVQVAAGCHKKYNPYTVFGSAYTLFDDDDEFYSDKDNHWSMAGFYNCDINEADLQNYFQELVIHKCLELCDFSRIEGVSELKHISLKKCHGIEVLFSLSDLPDQALLESIQYLDLYRLENLNLLIRRRDGGVPYGSSFSNLTRFVLRGCPSIKQVFPVPVLRNLKNLKRLYVMNCPLVEEIFASDKEEEEEEEEEEVEEMAGKKSYFLSSLRAFRLLNLPELKRFSGGRTRFWIPCGCALDISGCPKLTADGLLISTKTRDSASKGQ